MKRHSHTGIVAVFAGLAILGLASTAAAQQPIFRLSADYQWTPVSPSSFSTTATDGPAATGGTVTYSKILFTPYPVLYVTFAGTGTTHDGAALRMACTVDSGAGPVPCQSGGGPLDAASGWITLQKMPASIEDTTNCTFGPFQGDGFGGTGNCHHNNINYVWCAVVTPGVKTIEIKLASDTGGAVYYGRSHILIDGTKNTTAGLCVPSTPPWS